MYITPIVINISNAIEKKDRELYKLKSIGISITKYL